jgi:GTP cyclohydrolase I
MDEKAAAAAIDAFLRAIGRNPDEDPELRGTGERVASAYIHDLCRGYAVDVAALLRENTFAGAASGPVVLRDVAVTTTCPHHLMLSSGSATIAYEPAGKIVGVGALARLVDAFANRLILQESIGEAVCGALSEHVAPRWCACRLVMSHGCMTARGERRHGARLETVAFRGDRALALAAIGAGA